MIGPFTRTRFRSEYHLDTWYPVGVLDGAMSKFMANYTSFHECIADEAFNRCRDQSRLMAIHLDFTRLPDLAG